MSEYMPKRLEPPLHTGVGILDRVPAELVDEIVANQSVRATQDFQLDYWQNETVIKHCLIGIGLARQAYTSPNEVKLAIQSPTQQRKYLVTPNEAGVIIDGMPYSPMGITLKGILLTYEMMLSRTLMTAKKLARTSPSTITQRLRDSRFAEGVATSATAEADTDIPNILAEAMPAPRVLTTTRLDKPGLRQWIERRTHALNSAYPAAEQIDKVTESDGSIVLVEQAEDDVRILDITPPFGSRRTSGPYSFPRALGRAARAFMREVTYYGNGDPQSGETHFLASYGSPTLGTVAIIENLQEMSTENVSRDALRAYCALMAGEIGRTYGAILSKAPTVQDRLGVRIALPLEDDLQNWSIRGRYHDYEVLLSGPPITEKEAQSRAILCTEIQTEQVYGLSDERKSRQADAWRKQYLAKVALEAFQYAAFK
ncbi:MAG TPA: hypothetical protein VFT53_01145 [Candidatus Saccharimonadales bacterium]|nr:hypothetical protein [Candidatus Saccharimonadales bacterium]